MKTTDFNIDIMQATDCYSLNPRYDQSYPTTNEPIQWELRFTRNNGARVLTVAASGDQPLFYAGAGAEHVDTFDIVCASRVIMDFKTTALQNMNDQTYANTIKHMHNLDNAKNLHMFMETVDGMPAATRELMRYYLDYRKNIFERGFINDRVIPTRHEYEMMQKNIRAPFNFAWTDIRDLHKYLDQKYDVINISNILEYLPEPYDIQNTVSSLIPFLRPGGKIIANVMASNPGHIMNALTWVKNTKSQLLKYDFRFKTILIQKSR